jgi:fatty-acyl-CoA synthase
VCSCARALGTKPSLVRLSADGTCYKLDVNVNSFSTTGTEEVTTPVNELYRSMFLPDLLIAALDRSGDRPAVYIDGDVLTAAQMRDEISRYTQAFRRSGIVQRDGVATLSKNRPEVLCSMGAVMISGCRNTPLHPLGSLDDHAYVLEDAGIETLIFDPSFAERAAQLRERVPCLKRLLSYGPSSRGSDLVALAATFSAQRLAAPHVDPEDLSALAYTGGTTGKPKGVMSTYRGSAAMAQIMVSEWQWPVEVRHLVCTPLSHAGSSLFVPLLLRGGSMVVLPAFEPGAVLEAIELHRITTVMLVPSMIYSLLDHPRFAETDLSSLQTIYYGASPMSPTRLQEAIRKMGSIFFQFYGQTECPQSVCILRKEDHDANDLDRLASCGRPVPWVRVGLLDDEGNEVPKGDPGELCVRGPLVMKGYWNKPEETAEALDHGWLHTGDVAREDEHGFLTIVDRKKDMIVSGGFNIFPREIEDVISTHPSVAAVAVVGVPDEKWGEAVKAVVVARSGETLDVEGLIALVKDRKGSHHAPKSIDIVDSIPMSPLGKPDKKALRARYWAGANRLVS